jgi:hypothetical protein
MRRGIVYIDKNYAEFGCIAENCDNIKIHFEGNIVWGCSYEALKDHLGFDYHSGYYVIGKDVNQYYYPPGRDLFPYNLDRHIYNMKFEEELFKNKQDIQSAYSFKFINELPYTFGLEFETAGGFLPQHRLYELGLIPLRDGSISGIEYTTVVLQGNSGLNLLKKQVEELSKATIFDKDCSLHIHLGNFKLTTDVILAINNLFTVSNITSYVPHLTFETHRYKTNTEKNYCEFNRKYRNFSELYIHLVDRYFYGDFKQPHPKDLTGTRKWNIKSRYKAVNLINAICYDGPKTVEYRLLRPTYNFDKILGWLFIYGAYIKYAELYPNLPFRTGISLERMIRSVYSTELADILCEFLSLSERVIYAQGQVGDLFGMRVDIEDRIINYETFGHYFY